MWLANCSKAHSWNEMCVCVCVCVRARARVYVCLAVCLQEKDLKQYMDDCGNIMSMTNVKVSIDILPCLDCCVVGCTGYFWLRSLPMWPCGEAPACRGWDKGIFFFFSFVRSKLQSPRWRWQCIAGPSGFRRACGLWECCPARFPFWVARRWGRTAVDVLLFDCQYCKGTSLYGWSRVWNTGDNWGACGLSWAWTLVTCSCLVNR